MTNVQAQLQEIEKLKSLIAQRKAGITTPPQPSQGFRGRGRGRGRGSGRGSRGGRTPQTFANRSLVVSKPETSTNASSGPIASTSSSTQTPKEVTIDGVIFVSDAAGRKLVRKAVAASSDPSTPAAPSPARASISGQTFVRTKSGNLVAQSLVQKRANADKVKRINSMLNMTRGAHRSLAAYDAL